MGSTRGKRKKSRELRAARRRLQPIRGARGKRLQHRRLGAPRVVGLDSFAQGLAGRRSRWRPPGGARAWVLSALPIVILVIWVVARVVRHL